MTEDSWTLYTFFQSSAAYRTRIALNLKGIKPSQHFVHLTKGGGQHLAPDYKKVNPQQLVPTLVHNGISIGQSLAQIEYLEEVIPEPPLLPKDPLGRARVRSLAYTVAADIHPVNNLRIRKFLHKDLNLSEAEINAWQERWIVPGFEAMEEMTAHVKETGRFCHGDMPGLADICLIPQIANARRIGMDMARFPTLNRIDEIARTHPAFAAAAPDKQPDAAQ
jgi:maleylpyruvate isomerase